MDIAYIVLAYGTTTFYYNINLVLIALIFIGFLMIVCTVYANSFIVCVHIVSTTSKDSGLLPQ